LYVQIGIVMQMVNNNAMKYFILVLMMISTDLLSQQIRVATFNVSMEADNYVSRDTAPRGDELFVALASAKHPQIKNIAEIIQRTRPDIILLNEFDYSADSQKGIQAFVTNYLNRSQQGAEAISYPYFYLAPVNTGVDSGADLNNDGLKSGKEGDAFGYGKYPGQYGMVLLSRYPIMTSDIRTFQQFLWKDMPNGLLTSIQDPAGQQWYSSEAQSVFRLSSKSHWDVPVNVNGAVIHILASHPTPPVFDGPENRNGKRNHDEIRFWSDYITGGNEAAYIYDDKEKKGGLRGKRFVIVGDLNSSQDEGDSIKSGIKGLLSHPKVMPDLLPRSKGADENDPKNPISYSHTAAWKMQVDYVIVSKSGLLSSNAGVFWPTKDSNLYRLVESRKASSDHRLVWVDLKIEQ
jgi:endonuclease/exonuclease/phosphatase family metal-dependent hydrolase